MPADSLIVSADTIRKNIALRYFSLTGFMQKKRFLLPFCPKKERLFVSTSLFFAFFCLFSLTFCKICFQKEKMCC